VAEVEDGSAVALVRVEEADLGFERGAGPDHLLLG
jgi:hypothetical protein